MDPSTGATFAQCPASKSGRLRVGRVGSSSSNAVRESKVWQRLIGGRSKSTNLALMEALKSVAGVIASSC